MERSLPFQKATPVPPPLPCPPAQSCSRNRQVLMDQSALVGFSPISAATGNMWDRLFDEGYEADVKISTDGGVLIYAHASVLVSVSWLKIICLWGSCLHCSENSQWLDDFFFYKNLYLISRSNRHSSSVF